MTFGTCFNCGDPGHFASSCPASSAKVSDRPVSWHAPARRYDQDEINARGIALCRAALRDARLTRAAPAADVPEP